MRTMPGPLQKKPMRHVMVFTRAFRAPLQAKFSPPGSDLPEELCRLLEMADIRAREASQGQRED